ncbi:putative disease resistance protein [Vitis vinifera]|uniref:Putative disease resistance protein n=1 Tax=Vitis vinifera TaxID=29760 RepID=A0A438FDI9_VITVI|nr:putative disease resistance protein [Vitis vinifera]
MRQKLNAFLKGKRYLIVLEDASRVNFLNELVRTLPDASNGSKMILTTRSMRLPSKLQRASVHHAVQLRGDNESWALFTHSLKVNISQELKDATIEEWSSALQQLNQEQQQLWSYTLSRINEDLPLGLVQAEDENETPEDVADRYLITLIGKGMVRVTKNKLNGNVKSCLLPDALRRYWSSKALQATFLQVGTNTKSESSLGTGMIRRLTDHLDKGDVSFDHIHGDRKTISASVQPLYREVVSFLSFDTQEGSKPGEDIGNFLHRCISSSCLLLLRVLDLENVFKPKFPEALGKLTRLRYLGLRSTFLDVLPSFVNKLQSLQALDVMPQPSVGSSSTLRVLVGLFVDEETPVTDGLDQFINLRKLGLTCHLPSSQQEAVVEWVQKLNNLESLRLKSIDEENQFWDLDLKPLAHHVNLSCLYLLGRLKNPSVGSKFPHSLIELTLSGSELEEDPMQTLDKLPNLKVLRFLANSYLGKNMGCSSGGFPQLQVLKLWKLEQLEEWNVDEGALQALWDLDIRSCKRLKMLPEALRHRARLKLKLTDMCSQFASWKEDH